MTGVTVGEQTLLVNQQAVPVYSGAVHYWRLERDCWPAVLDQVKALGFGMLETYIPWSVHESASGAYDWGEGDPRKDLEAFMRLCEERGLWLLVRPGPLINAELTDFGFPERVLLDPAVQALTALDSLHLDAAWGLHPPRPFPVPSYASERFFELVGEWFDQVCPIIVRHLAPNGCVVGVQSDNETCYLFHDLPYATDYSPDSLRLYRRFLADQHRDIERLNELYGATYTSFDQVQPPRDGRIECRGDVPLRLDWIAYKEYQIRWSVARIARQLRQRGIQGIPIFHDVAFQYKTPLDISRLETEPDVDWVGLNLYRPPWEHRPLADRVRFLAGSTRLPFVPELGAGIWSHHPATPTPAEQEFVTLSCLMYGIKAFNLYMLVERDRWQGSPITRHGTLRPEFAPFYAGLLEFLNGNQFWRFRRSPRALVLLNYDLERFEAANSTLNWGHTDLLRLPPQLFQFEPDLGLGATGPAQTWLASLTRGLQAASVDYDLSDTHLGAERLARYAVIFVQSAEFLAQDDQQRLLDYARAGGRLIVGPVVPEMDAYLRSCNALGQAAEAVSEAALGGLVDELKGGADFQSDLEVVAHTDGSRILLFVSNPTPDAVESAVRFSGRRTFGSVWGPAATHSEICEVVMQLPPYTVRIWEVSQASD